MQSQYARLPVVLLALLATNGFAVAAGGTTGTLTGRVVDAANRANEAVKITVNDGDKVLATAYSDSEGKFTLKDVPAGKGYTILAVRTMRAMTMTGKKENVTVKADKSTDVGDVQIAMGSPG